MKENVVEVSNISKFLKKHHLEEIFNAFGAIIDIEWNKRKPRTVEISYKDLAAAKEAVDCFHHGIIDNRKVFLKLLSNNKTQKPVKAVISSKSKLNSSRNDDRNQRYKRKRSVSRSPSSDSYDSYYSYYSYYSYSDYSESDRRSSRKPTTRKKK